MMNPQHVPVSRPPFLNCHYPNDLLFFFFFLLFWPILNSVSPFFTFPWMTPLFNISFIPNCPLLFFKSYYDIKLYCGTCIGLLVNDRLEFFKVFYNWLPNDPQFSKFFISHWPDFYCTWYGMAWFLLGLFTEWSHIVWRIHILPDRHIPVGTHLSLQIGSVPPMFLELQLHIWGGNWGPGGVCPSQLPLNFSVQFCSVSFRSVM